jgi:MFS family permease
VAERGVRAALAPLAERDFRLLFFGRTISRLGGSFSAVALAFAVLEIGGGAGAVGVVFAAFTLSQFVFILFGGVWADRLPRNVVMVGANLVNGAVQLAAAALILTGVAEVWHIASLAAMNGFAQAFFFPASQGIVPQLVPAARLQEANALLRLSLNGTNIGGSALAGGVVAATGAGWAIAIDGASFLISAVLLSRIRLPRRTMPRSRLLVELREGWDAFASRRWLWVVVIAFGFINAFWASGLNVLGPVVADAELGGPAAWGLVVSSSGLGLVAGGALSLRWRPRRALLVGMLGTLALAFPLGGLALGAPVALLVVMAFAGGIGIELFGVFWDLSMQQHVPRELLSRVYAYDMLGSIALMPLGYLIVGPLSAGFGVHATLWICVGSIVALCLATLAVRDVRALERRDPAPDAAPVAVTELS